MNLMILFHCSAKIVAMSYMMEHDSELQIK